MVDDTEQKLDLAIENLETQLNASIIALYKNKHNLDSIVNIASTVTRLADTLQMLKEIKEVPITNIKDWQKVE